MADTIIAQAEPVLVAIDITKARHEVLISVPRKMRRRRLTVLNRLDDFDRSDEIRIGNDCQSALNVDPHIGVIGVQY